MPMSDEFASIVSDTSRQDYATCENYVSALAGLHNPMLACSTSIFRDWYAIQHSMLKSDSASNRGEVNIMLSALFPLRMAEVPARSRRSLIQTGIKALFDLDENGKEPEHMTVIVLWLICLIKEGELSGYDQEVIEVLSFFKRRPGLLHRAAGHGPAISWLENMSQRLST